MDSKHYVPILLTKRGERHALRDLPGLVHDSMTPILVVAPIDWDYEEERPAKTVTQHLSRLPGELHEARGDRLAIIDLPFLEDDEPLDNGHHPLVWLTARCQTPLIPAVSISRSDDYKTAVATVVARDGRGACLRLQIDEWPINVGAELDVLLGDLAIDPAEVDLVLDLGDETGDLALTVARQQIAALPHINDWRSVVITGTGMPKDLPQGQGVHEIERREWNIYRSLVADNGPRVPTFGDYGIANPDPTLDVDPKLISLSANVRYTTNATWLVPKGQLFKGRGGSGLGAAAVPPVLATLRAQPSYANADHCGLEQWVENVVATQEHGGNPEAWRRYGTQHHLQFVTEQIANLHGV